MATIDVVILVLINAKYTLIDHVSKTLSLARHEIVHLGRASVFNVHVEHFANLETVAFVLVRDIDIVKIICWSRSDSNDSQIFVHGELEN